jgi:16S rRNA (adenine1518-N6/adenine1519-N6)-dimethyltransferase
MKLSEMRQILADQGIQLTKSLGQNFLHDQNQLRRIVGAADLKRADKILEIGPGLGPLTALLIETAEEVLAIEKDARLVRLLAQRFDCEPESSSFSGRGQARSASGRTPALRLVHDDALLFLRRKPHDWRDWKLVANLPYSVASPLLVELAQGGRAPQRIVATLQIEVAKRLMANPGQKDYGVLTLLIQLDYQPLGLFRIPASCFFPQPDVDSACVTLAKRVPSLLRPELRLTFVDIVKRGFSQRRKMMLKLLREPWSSAELEAAFREVGLATETRAESVSVDRFVRLAEVLHLDQPMNEEIFDIVNERDEVIGQKPRNEVHRLGLLHRAAHVLVFNSRGQVFLQKRSMQKDRQPGVWDSSASGHLDRGEEYDACALRELREEIGLRLDVPPERLFKLPASKETDHEHVWVYRCQAEGPFTLHPGEIERGGWFTKEEVTRWMRERPEEFATALLIIWPRVLDSH